MPKFYTKRGWLTPYAMACGYIHYTELSRSKSVRFQKLECDTPSYDVTVFDRDAKGARCRTTNSPLRDGIAFSEVFPSIDAARQTYRAKTRAFLRRRFEPWGDVNRMVIC